MVGFKHLAEHNIHIKFPPVGRRRSLRRVVYVGVSHDQDKSMIGGYVNRRKARSKLTQIDTNFYSGTGSI